MAHRLIERCLGRGAEIRFFSSDTVYASDSNAGIDEHSPCAPAEPYGRMKLEVEERFVGQPGSTTLRLSYVVSHFDAFTCYLRACVLDSREADIIRGFRRMP